MTGRAVCESACVCVLCGHVKLGEIALLSMIWGSNGVVVMWYSLMYP